MHIRPSVSVVIPAYNAASTLDAAIRSVLRQTLPASEIIVIDDGSTDRTREVAVPFCPEVQYAQQQNAGPASARNRGARLARGEWLAFLDSDDQWLPCRLKWQIERSMEYPEFALWCGENRPLLLPGVPVNDEEDHRPSNGAVLPLRLEDFVQGNPVATSTVLVNRAAFFSAGGFDEQFRGPEDYDLWMRMAARWKLAKIDAPLSLFRHTRGSLSMDDRSFLPQVLRVLEKAFARDGAFAEHPEWRLTALATQYWSASWMAFNRGDRGRALRLWFIAFTRNLAAKKRPRRRWCGLLGRYLVGRP